MKNGPAKGFSFGQINLQKAYFTTTSGSNYTPLLGVKVEPEIVSLHPANDAFRARLASRAVENKQLAAVFDVLTGIDFVTATDPFFTQGGCPPAVVNAITQSSKTKAHYGVQGGLTNAAIAALGDVCDARGYDGKIQDAMEQQLTVLDIAFRNSEDWAMINGDDSSNPLAFDGLEQEVTTAHGSLVLDLEGTALAKADITDVISVQALRGVYPSMILGNPLLISRVQELFYNTINAQVEQQNPYQFVTIPTPSGNIALVGDVHVPVTYVSGNNYTSDLYILTEMHNGVPLIYMDYLIPESILPDYVFHNGTTCTSTGMGMYAVGTLVSRANVAQAKIENVGFSYDAALNTSITTLSSLIV